MMNKLDYNDLGKLVLRISIAVPLLVDRFIAWQGLQTMGINMTALFLLGIIAPILICLGLFIRWAVVLMILQTAGSIVVAYINMSNDLSFNWNWGVKQAFGLGVFLSILLLGSGRYAIRPL